MRCFELSIVDGLPPLGGETDFIAASLAFLEAQGLSHLRMVIPPLEVGYPNNLKRFQLERPELIESAFLDIAFVDDRIVTVAELPDVLKMMLRGVKGCSLQFDGRFSLHKAGEGAVHIACAKAPDSLPDFAHINIAAIPSPGPFMPKGDVEVLVDIADRGSDTIRDVDQPFLSQFSRRELRDMLGIVSREHPFVTAFKLTPEMGLKLAAATAYEFDFGRFDYYINTFGSDY